MARVGVVVYIYTVGGSDREVAEPMGRRVAVRGGWMDARPVVEGGGIPPPPHYPNPSHSSSTCL
jgi:hypothetical protein